MMKWVRGAVFALLSLSASAQSQQAPPQTPKVQTEQQPNSAAEPEPQRAQKTNTAEEKTTIADTNTADNAEGKADRDAQKRTEEAGEYWPFPIFGARLKITDSLLALFTFFLIIVGIVQGIFLRLTNRGTQKAAEAAALNARAVINAERAQLFISIENENIVSIISTAATAPVPQHMEDGQIPALRLSYAFKNFGKTPAIIRDMKHGVLVAPDLLRVREYESVVDLPAHVLGAGEKTSSIDVIDLPRLTVRDARSISGAESTFWFYGTLIYDDTFGWRRTLKFICHYGADSNGLRIFEYRETEERRKDEE